MATETPTTGIGRRVLGNAPKHLRPNYQRPEYEKAQEQRDLCDALMEGTSAIQAGGTKFMKQWHGEKDKNYEIRKTIARVARYYKRIVEAVGGMINSTPAALAKGSNAVLVKWADDVDGQGRAFGPFAHDITIDAANGGFVAILVDHPSVPAGRTLRLDQEDALQLRPFMVPIKASRIPSWIIEVPDWEALIEAYLNDLITAEAALAYAKQVILRQVSIYEPVEIVAPGAFGPSAVDRFRVLRLTDDGVTYTVWEHRKPENEAEYFTVVAEGPMLAAGKPQREIPLAICYGGRKVAPFVAAPPMLSVAELNLDHHVITSDRRNLMRVCHAPTLFLAGFDDDSDAEDGDGTRARKPVEVGPNSVLRARNPEAKASYISAPADALKSSQEERREIVQQIQAIGMAFVGVDRKTNDTATGRVLDDAAENANISTMSEGVRDGLGQAWRFMAMHRKNVEAPTVEMKTTYASPRVDPQIATVLWNAVAADKLDVDSWLEYIKTGELPEDLAKRVEFLRVKNAKDDVPTGEDDLNKADGEKTSEQKVAA